MIFLGSSVLCTKSVVATRACGWEVGFESTTLAFLHDNPSTDDELIKALIAGARLEPIVLDCTVRSDQEFQLAYAPAVSGLEDFYTFSREIFYEGDPILWKQKPCNGYHLKPRLRLTATGSVFFEGYCTKGEQQHIAHWLNCIVLSLGSAFNHMRPLVDAYNAKLVIAAQNYVEINRRMIAELRRVREAA